MMSDEQKKTNLLKLEREFKTKKYPATKRNVSLFGGRESISSEDIAKLADEFKAVKESFKDDTLLNGYVVFTIRCNKIMAKSNRVSWLFSFKGKKANEWVVGSSFYGDGNRYQQITYSLPKDKLDVVLERLEWVKETIVVSFGGSITKQKLSEIRTTIGEMSELFANPNLKKTNFVDTCQEITFIKDVIVDRYYKKTEQSVLVNLIQVPSISSTDVLGRLGITPIPTGLPEGVYLLTSDDANKLGAEAPYLIVSQTADFATFDFGQAEPNAIDDEPYIGRPNNEPVIGVIDGLFAKDKPELFKNPYFSEWVENHDMLEKPVVDLDVVDFAHGTEVDSLLVDLPRLNPDLNDGCGNFRVRHFGIATSRGVSVSYMIKTIRAIVEDPRNGDIKVWNLSLGNSVCEINKSYVSLEGALLDELQSNNPNIVFVVSGTNKKTSIPNPPTMIGAPADSINSIVVNSVTFDDEPASYSRCGPALSFFIKPDVSTYGGNSGQELYVWSPWGKWHNSGTSFAAPLIARKMAFLMGVMKLDRNVAKALIIDSVMKWDAGYLKNSNYLGRGIVKPSIEEIVKGDNDEIKFFIQGRSKEYLTYTYSLPVPLCDDNKYHYRARATLCYFPVCSRNQGVDYTNTELSLQFGRLKKGDKGIDTIDKYRSYLEEGFTFESDARKAFRKWDNLKTIIDSFPSKKMPGKEVLNANNKNWGIHISYNERSANANSSYIDWGLVITLKATDGINRFNDFVHACEFNGWLVTPIIYENYVELSAKLNEEIELD